MTPSGSQESGSSIDSMMGNRMSQMGLSRTAKRRMAVAGKFRNRPLSVRRAIANASVFGDELGLTNTDQMILVAIIATCVDAKNGQQEMFAKKATLARQANCSEATFYRSYGRLRQLGVITVNKQQRHTDGSLAISTFALSEWACNKLGLTSQQQAEVAATAEKSMTSLPDEPPAIEVPIEFERVDDHQQETAGGMGDDRVDSAASAAVLIDHVSDGMRDGLSNVDQKFHRNCNRNAKQSFGNQSAPGRDGNSPAPQFVRRHGRMIPADVSDLVDRHGITASAVLKLMGTASAGGHRLSDVYQVVRGTLDRGALTGKARFGYLLRCASNRDRDWRVLRSRQDAVIAKHTHQRKSEAKAQSLVGQWFRATSNGTVWQVEQGLNCIRLQSTDGRGIILNPEVTDRVLADIAAGVLVRLHAGVE